MKRTLLGLMGLAVIFTLAFQGIASAKTYTFRLQCVYPEKAYMGQTTQFFADRVKELTDGNVQIKVFTPDQLVKTNEAFDAMAKGMIDAYSGSMLYFAGYVPEVNCEWLPFGWANSKEVQEMYEHHGWLDLMREALKKHKVHYVAPMCCGDMGLLTKFPVHQLADMKGRKIRAVGMEGKIVEALGGSPVALSGAEQYMALSRGTVDGTDYPFYTIENYKFYEVVSHIIRPGLHTPGVIEILFNQKSLEKLPDNYRAAIDEAGWDAFLRTVALSPQWDEVGYQTCREKNIEIIDLAPEVVNQFRKATLPLWDEIASKSEVSAKLVDSLKHYLTQKGIQMD